MSDSRQEVNMGKISEWFAHAWNAFTNKDTGGTNYGQGSYSKPDRIVVSSRGSERSILNAALNRIALDCASVKIRHVKLDDNERMIEVMKSTINERLNVDANEDQTGRALLQNAYLDMLDKGIAVIVPTRTDVNPNNTEAYKILELRTAVVKQWYPKHIRAEIYNEETGKREEVMLLKKETAIVENPMYAVMNDTNSTFNRLNRKLSLLDIVDEQSGSGKLDMIIQLPYTIKSEARRAEARRRRDDLEDQIKNSKLGIAYTDATEKVIQLNKSLENNLLKQIEYLTNLFYSQLGITPEIMNGTADETAMNNYYNRTIEPLVSALTEEMHRKFLTKTARTQKQAIRYYRDPFKLMPVNSIAEIADKFTRNEIMTANEIRQIIGMKPSGDPKSDELRNANIAEANGNGEFADSGQNAENLISDLDSSDKALDELEASLGHSATLMHYASKYYDPVKAHEYYERTKKLKGRSSDGSDDNATLNDEGKKIAAYVKNQINTEKTNKVNNTRLQAKRVNESQAAALKNKVNSLTRYVQQLSPERRKEETERIKDMIKNLRDQNARERQKIQIETNDKVKGINEDYSNKYQDEYKRIGKEYPGSKSSKKSGGGSVARYKKRFWMK